jgi:hypothetical protein
MDFDSKIKMMNDEEFREHVRAVQQLKEEDEGLDSVKSKKPPIYAGRQQQEEEYNLKPGSLLQRGNYAIFRILSIINAAGAAGIITVALHQELGAHTNRINAVIRKAHELGLIDRIKGERPGPGQFASVYNVITKKGKQLLTMSISQ